MESATRAERKKPSSSSVEEEPRVLPVRRRSSTLTELKTETMVQTTRLTRQQIRNLNLKRKSSFSSSKSPREKKVKNKPASVQTIKEYPGFNLVSTTTIIHDDDSNSNHPTPTISPRLQRDGLKRYDEIIQTEKKYVLDLEMLMDNYLLPIQTFVIQHPDINYSTASDVSSPPLFVLDTICMLNHILSLSRTLVLCFEYNWYSRSEQSNNECIISDTFFLYNTYLLKYYSPYIASHRRTTATLKKIFLSVNKYILTHKRNYLVKGSQTHRDNREEAPPAESSFTTTFDVESLSSLLIKPIQRICRYPLLIEKIIHNIPETHCDYSNLNKVLLILQDLNSILNSDNNNQDNSNKHNNEASNTNSTLEGSNRREQENEIDKEKNKEKLKQKENSLESKINRWKEWASKNEDNKPQESLARSINTKEKLERENKELKKKLERYTAELEKIKTEKKSYWEHITKVVSVHNNQRVERGNGTIIGVESEGEKEFGILYENDLFEDNNSGSCSNPNSSRESNLKKPIKKNAKRGSRKILPGTGTLKKKKNKKEKNKIKELKEKEEEKGAKQYKETEGSERDKGGVRRNSDLRITFLDADDNDTTWSDSEESDGKELEGLYAPEVMQKVKQQIKQHKDEKIWTDMSVEDDWDFHAVEDFGEIPAMIDKQCKHHFGL